MDIIIDNQMKFKKGLYISLGLSLFLHLMIMGKSLSLHSPQKMVKKTKERRIKISFKNDDSTKKQIVNSEAGIKEKPKDAKFAGKRDQVVERETVAKKVGSFKRAGLGVKNGNKVSIKVKKRIVKKPIAKKETSKKAHARSRKKKVTIADLAIKAKAIEQKEMPSLAALGLKNGFKKNKGLAQSNDFVEDLPLGDLTKLNTTEDEFFGFYDRIKKKLDHYWIEKLREKAGQLYSQGRGVASEQHKITSLQIVLDKMGNVVDIIVKSSSGISEFDDAAIESFNKAGPFPNPPLKMMKNGYVVLDWGFVVRS